VIEASLARSRPADQREVAAGMLVVTRDARRISLGAIDNLGVIAALVPHTLRDLCMTRGALEFLPSEPDRMALAALQNSFKVSVRRGKRTGRDLAFCNRGSHTQ